MMRSNNCSIVACVFVAAVSFLQSRCLATVRDTHTVRVTEWIYEASYLDGRRCHDVHSQVSLNKIGGGLQKLLGRIHRQQANLISLLLFYQNKEIMLKR
jgi:hypothetical protein